MVPDTGIMIYNITDVIIRYYDPEGCYRAPSRYSYSPLDMQIV